MPLHPRTCSLLYSISCILDALDGFAARHYNQSTTFGAVLDMVTDRCTTACLLVFLSSAWPRWAILFQGLISLDMASHYMHMYATLTMGGAGQSHKKVDSSRSWILHQYYTNKAGSSSPPPPPFIYDNNADTARRPCCSSAALSMSSSSSAYIFFLSPRPCCRRLSCSRPPARRAPLRSLPSPSPPIYSPVHGALVLWSWHARTSWTVFGLG